MQLRYQLLRTEIKNSLINKEIDDNTYQQSLTTINNGEEWVINANNAWPTNFSANSNNLEQIYKTI